MLFHPFLFLLNWKNTMGYIDTHLTDSEEIVFRTKRHWINTVPVPLVIMILAGLCYYAWGKWEQGWLMWPAFVLTGASLIMFSCRHAINWASEFGVTSRRVIIKTGLVRRNTLEVILQKVESVSVEQSVLGRILGYGTLTVTGSGGSSEPYRDISQPLEFRKQVQIQVGKLNPDNDND
jgi:uncharacterized membrane protein YdbT with pleckstrin-like domain